MVVLIMKMMIMKSLLISRDSIYDSYRECQKKLSLLTCATLVQAGGYYYYYHQVPRGGWRTDLHLRRPHKSGFLLKVNFVPGLSLLLKMHDKKYCQKKQLNAKRQ